MKWIEDYYYQLVAYATAHNEVYGTSIDQGNNVYTDCFFQRFILNGKDLENTRRSGSQS